MSTQPYSDGSIPRPRRNIAYGPDPGTINITRRRTISGISGWDIRVGNLHIQRRHISPNFANPVCSICGHPYDHMGRPHSIYEAERTMQRKPPIRRGETLTGPDGGIYKWDGTVWYRL